MTAAPKQANRWPGARFRVSLCVVNSKPSAVADSAGRASRLDAAPRWADAATEAGLCFLVVFTPWVFGTTQHWSIQVTNGVCYILGGLLVVKWAARLRRGLSRKGTPGEGTEGAARVGSWRAAALSHGRVSVLLAALTGLVLVFCLVSAVNARATYNYALRQFDYHSFLPWLPHSYESLSRWAACWNYLAMACAFWAARD